MICDTCGTQGNEDDAIEVGGECAWEDCPGTILREEGDDPWVESPTYPMTDWRDEVWRGNTLRGYHDWVAAQREEER